MGSKWARALASRLAPCQNGSKQLQEVAWVLEAHPAPSAAKTSVMRCLPALMLQPYLHPALRLGVGSPFQRMGSHQC